MLYHKRIVVTGGAGFIGSELVTQLAAEQNTLVVIDNLVNGKRANLEHLDSEQVRLVETDIRDSDALPALLRNVDIVFHLACLGVRHSLHNPVENHEVNATATLKLLEAARRAEVPRFVYVSSSEVYGTARWAPMTEEHPTFPMTVYGSAKLAGECYTRAYYESYGYPTVVVRPFNSFGPRSHHEGDSGEVIPKFMLRCMAGKPLVIFGDGSQTRDFTYVSDTARGILLAGSSTAAVGATLNIGQGREISINELARTVAAVVAHDGAEIAYDQPRPGDVLRLYADSSRARDLLGFTPSVSLDEGLQKLHSWYMNCGQSVEILLSQERIHNWKAKEI
jgi:UDP-glucose 4-epimerase